MTTSRIFNKILTKGREDYSQISTIMEKAEKTLFSMKPLKNDGLFFEDEKKAEQEEKKEFIDSGSSLVIENYKYNENIKIISANRSEMELNSITKIIPIASGKYESISEFIDRHNRLLMLNKKNPNEIFIFSLAKKRSIVSLPNTLNKDYLMMKSLQTPVTTITKTAINTLALGSFKMMSTILTSTFGSMIGIAITLLSVLLTVKKQGGSRAFMRFTLIVMLSQILVTVGAIVWSAFTYGLESVVWTGFICLGVFFAINQVGKLIIQYFDTKMALKIEKLYDGYLYARVKNRINQYD